MTEHPKIQPYINNFRRRLVRYLAEGIGASIVTRPSEAGGAIVEVRLGPDESNTDQFTDSVPTVNDALKEIQQNAFGGNIDGIKFGGTGLILDPARIVIIKADNSDDLWTDEASDEDVKRIMKAVTTPKQQPVATS